LISSQINNEHHEKKFCDWCLKFSYTEEKFKQDIEFCEYYLEHEKGLPILPEKVLIKLSLNIFISLIFIKYDIKILETQVII
jgi:hypothetical protein